MSIRIVGLGGSMTAPSSSLFALRVALDGAAAAGAEVELIDVRELQLPFYDPNAADVPSDAAWLAETAVGADAMIWSTPMYHGTVSGSFKNALDWLQLLVDRDPAYLSDMPIGLTSSAGGVQALQAINTMEFVVRALRAWTVPFVVPIAKAYQQFEADGTPRNPAVVAQLHMLGDVTVSAARRFVAGAALGEPT
jgi:FMN reductase